MLGIDEQRLHVAAVDQHEADGAITVVDGQGRIRGWYDSQDPEQVARLAERVRFLAGGE